LCLRKFAASKFVSMESRLGLSQSEQSEPSWLSISLLASAKLNKSHLGLIFMGYFLGIKKLVWSLLLSFKISFQAS
jgi:hypothetical protein